MHNHIPCIEHIPTAPTCPACGLHYELSSFDLHQGRACCPGCGTLYFVDPSYQPCCPDEFFEFGPLTPSQAAALEQFRDELMTVAVGADGELADLSYDLYVYYFSKACAPLLDDVAPELRQHALTIARQFGFVAEAADGKGEIEPEVCPFTGIDEDHCDCNRHS